MSSMLTGIPSKPIAGRTAGGTPERTPDNEYAHSAAGHSEQFELTRPMA